MTTMMMVMITDDDDDDDDDKYLHEHPQKVAQTILTCKVLRTGNDTA